MDCMDFPPEGRISCELGRCMQCVRAWVHARVLGKIQMRPVPIWYSHQQCGEITLSIVGFVGIPSACNISLIHMSLQIVKKHRERLQ